MQHGPHEDSLARAVEAIRKNRDANGDAFYRLLRLRDELMKEIGRLLERGESGKTYEGVFIVGLPAFGQNVFNVFTVSLDCYLIGPNRHYVWSSDTLLGAVEKAEADVRSWIGESQQDGGRD